MTIRRWVAQAVALLVLGSVAGGPGAQAQDKKPAPRNRDQMLSAGVAYLKGRQTADGVWSKGGNPGVTGLVLIGLFRSGKVTADDPVAVKGLKFVESLIDTKEGHIAGGKSKVFHRNYVTCVNLIALQSSGQDKKYATVIAKATAYLKKLQWDEAQEKTPKDAFYGGVGYGPKTRPDLSNTQFFLDALKAAGVPAKDPAYKKSVIFVSRCQNLKGEHNDQSWADKINDGSFIYVLGAKKSVAPKDDRRPGHGGMTYAGLKSLVYGGVGKEDVRYKKAWDWVTKHYSVDENAGMPEGAGGRGYYYGLMTMARCLDALGVDVVVDAKGKKHDWRADITRALANRQRKDGDWANETDRWMESNPDLCTGYALIALSYCKPK